MERARRRGRLAAVPLELGVVRRDPMKKSDSVQTPSKDALPPPLRLRPQSAASPLGSVLKVFATGLTGGVISMITLTGMAASQTTMGATRGLQIDRQRQQRCIDLGVTPEELEAMDHGQASAAEETEPLETELDR